MKVVILYFCLSINCELLLVAIQFKARFWSSVSSVWGFFHMSIVFCAKATEPSEGPQLLGCLPWNALNPAAQACPRCNFPGLGLLLWFRCRACLKPFWFSVQYWVCNMFLQNITKSSGNSVVLVVPRCFLTMWFTAPHLQHTIGLWQCCGQGPVSLDVWLLQSLSHAVATVVQFARRASPAKHNQTSSAQKELFLHISPLNSTAFSIPTKPVIYNVCLHAHP